MEIKISIEQALEIAKDYKLDNEVSYCINELNMTPYEALYEWDLLKD